MGILSHSPFNRASAAFSTASQPSAYQCHVCTVHMCMTDETVVVLGEVEGRSRFIFMPILTGLFQLSQHLHWPTLSMCIYIYLCVCDSLNSTESFNLSHFTSTFAIVVWCVWVRWLSARHAIVWCVCVNSKEAAESKHSFVSFRCALSSLCDFCSTGCKRSSYTNCDRSNK